MKINIVNNSRHGYGLPSYETLMSAGMDLRSDTELTLSPGEHILIPTGLKISLPQGYEAMIRPRSGLAFKFGITVLNSPGTIDADYRGDIGVILKNHGTEDFVILLGDRIAQMVINKFERAEWVQVNTLDETERGEGGFGSTGKD